MLPNFFYGNSIGDSARLSRTGESRCNCSTQVLNGHGVLKSQTITGIQKHRSIREKPVLPLQHRFVAVLQNTSVSFFPDSP